MNIFPFPENQIEILREGKTWRLAHFKHDSTEAVLLSPVNIDGDNPSKHLLRIHSSCLFSEALGAIDCDCAMQLEASLQLIGEEGGVCVYVYEEGRGVGLQKKIQAIGVQQKLRCSTKKAFESLGFPLDARHYPVALGDALKAFYGHEDQDPSFTLLTNSLRKVELCLEAGIPVAGRRELICDNGTEVVKAYLNDKRVSLGHLIPNND